MSKPSIFHTLARSGQALSASLAVTVVILAQYNPPTDPPPRRQTSFTGSSQAVAGVPQRPFRFES